MRVSKQSVKKAFSKAAPSYDHAAVVQTEILKRILDRLNVLQPQAANILDLGSGTGLAAQSLQARYGQENYFALDMALPMLRYAGRKQAHLSVCADIENLPFQNSCLAVVFSASTLQWSSDVAATLTEVYRVLQDRGLFLFSTFGPSTLQELKHCFQQIDNQPHVNAFPDMHELGDAMLAFGYQQAVIESEMIIVEYAHPGQLFKDLQATGATNHIAQRSRGLMGANRLRMLLREYEQFQLSNGKYPASYEIIYGHGRKAANRQASSPDQWQPVKFL